MDAQSLAAGRCGRCGAALPEALGPTDPDAIPTLEMPDDWTEDAEPNTAPQQQPTTTFSSEATIDFAASPAGDALESQLTRQWEGNVAAGASDPHCTIKQKETVAGPLVSRSSLVVKSRQVRPPGAGEPGAAPLVDAPDYELLNVLGEGGMGVVYAARQSSIARTVAVKMLKPSGARSDEQREKFISEAVVTGELDHPNIVPIYDLGTNDAGALFYSMKRVRGTPWNQVIRQKSLDENLNILLRVADAVAFAHANGVIHRDLKPENVMLGDFGEVLVMDWGLARISPEFPNAEAVSQSAAMGGTPAYMAPEMATGPVEHVTTASDIYLLGAILHEIVTGRPPHTGSSVMACLIAAGKNRLVDTQQAGELYEIALRAMATEPADRYRSVQDFQTAIRQYQAHSESVLLTDSAANNLAAAQKTGDYELYSRILYALEEAIALWDGNRRAGELLSSARLAYARQALDRSDFDLGISLLDADDPAHRPVLEQLEAGRRQRDSHNRRMKLLKGLVAALVLAVVGIVAIAYVAVRTQRDLAVAQRDRAVKAEGEARENFQAAVAAREVAETQRQRAEREKDRAQQQRRLAVEAKQAEAYEAYLARIGLASAKIEENAFDRARQLLAQGEPALRHWEWGRLEYLCQLSRRTWPVGSPVAAVAFAPDGRHFASGDWQGKLRLWDLEAAEPLQTISQGQYVHAVAYDAAGKRVAAGSSDHTIGIYRAADGKLLQTLEGHTDGVLSVRFSPDGRRLLSSGYDQTARLWNLETGRTEQVLRGHSWWVWAAEFSPDARRLVTAGQDGKAIVWQLSDEEKNKPPRYEVLTTFSKHRGPVYAARFSPDGTHIASGGYDRRVLWWNPDQVQPVDVARRLDELPDPPAPFQELTRHEGPVRTLAFSPDGRLLVSGGQDNVLRVWRFSTGRPAAVLRGHASHVRSCAFSPRGRLLLSASRDGQIKLWEPDAYGEQFVLGEQDDVGQADAVLAARFSRDGRQIVTASRDRTATLWDAHSREKLRRFAEGHEFLASSAVFFAAGDRLATGAGDGTVRIWDVATGTEILRLADTGRTAALDVSDDGRRVVTGGNGNDTVVWDAATGRRVAVLQGHEAEITAVGFAPGGRLLATGDERGRCRLWQRTAEGDHWTGGHWLRGHSRAITSLAFVDQGRRLVTSSGDNTCGQWDVATGSERTELVLKHPAWVTDMAVSGDGKRALTACDDGRLRLWSLEDAHLLRTIEPTDDEAAYTAVDLSPDGRRALAVSAARATVELWDLDTGREIHAGGNPQQAWLDFGGRGGVLWAARFAPRADRVLTIGGNDARLWDVPTRRQLVRFSPHGAVASADISPDGRLLVTGSWDRSAKLWDIASGRAIRKLDRVHQDAINSVEFSPDGKRILTASDDGTARFWDAATGRPLEPVLRAAGARMRQARFSDDGQRVLTTSNDKTARIWNAATGELLQTLVGHQWAVLCGAFSRDGRRVITGSEDNTALVWDAQTGKALLKLAGHTDSVTSVAFSPDGARTLTGSQDNTAKLWDAQTGKEILTLTGHREALTSVSFSPDGRQALTSGRDGRTILWPTVDWHGADSGIARH